MSRSLFFVGLVAFTTALSFAGCTITTGDNLGDGGAGGLAGESSGGEGGATQASTTTKGGSTGQGGKTSQGGATQGGASQGGTSGQSSTLTMDEAIAKFCAISSVSACSDPCVKTWTDLGISSPNCADEYRALLVCLGKLNSSDFSCSTDGLNYLPSCETEDDAFLECEAQP